MDKKRRHERGKQRNIMQTERARDKEWDRSVWSDRVEERNQDRSWKGSARRKEQQRSMKSGARIISKIERALARVQKIKLKKDGAEVVRQKWQHE